MKKILAVLAAVVTLSGCASLESELKPWMGETKGSLIAKWGPPMSVQSDGQGGQILYYYRAMGYHSARIWMYAHKDGTLYFWRSVEQ